MIGVWESAIRYLSTWYSVDSFLSSFSKKARQSPAARALREIVRSTRVLYNQFMLTDSDVKKLKEILATKEDIHGVREEIGGLRSYTEKGFEDVREEIGGLRSYTEKGFEEVHQKFNGVDRKLEEVREEISDLRSMVQQLAVSVDGLTKAVDDLRIEYAAALGKLDRHERWIKQIAEKVGVHLEA